MQQALTLPNWRQPELSHWLKHSLLPLLLVALFLLLPKPWEFHQTRDYPTLKIELTKEQSTKPVEPVIIKPKLIEPKPLAKESVPANIKMGTAGGSPAIPQPKVQPQKPAAPTTKPTEQPQTKPQATTSDILLSVKNRISMDMPPEFQARTSPAKDFYIPEQEIQDWLADIPFLDESVDRPTIKMQFYSEGFTGHIEKFFDKITFKKTFTTKYGTKIHCAIIGVIAACGWK